MTKKKSSETSGVVENPDNLPSNLFDNTKIDIKALILFSALFLLSDQNRFYSTV